MPNPPVHKVRPGPYGDGGAPPEFGGGGGGGDQIPDFGGRLHRARLGLAVGLTPILMLFLSFTAVYLVRQGWLFPEADTLNAVRASTKLPLPWMLLLANTIILTISSITMELARRDAVRKAALAPLRSIPGVSLGIESSRPWLEVSTALGLLFLIGQGWAWYQLENRGFYLATTSASSFAYLLTGMHAVHLAGGVAALVYAMVVSRHRAPELQRITTDVVAWYWHFMGGLWLYIFLLLLLMR
jgi:cytochrome c oxidase subunit III